VIWVIAIGVLLLALAGEPFFVLIAAIAMWGLHTAGYDLTVTASEFYRLTEMPVLVAIPLFTIAGYLLGESGAPKRLVRLTDALIGSVPGGLAIVAVITCALFTAFTGATGVTIVALGAVLYPALLHGRYPGNFSLGLVTTSGSLGLLFAPSLPLILYAVVAQQLDVNPKVNVEDLFKAGVLPGLLMVAMLATYAVVFARKIPRVHTPYSSKEAREALWDARYELPLPVLVLVGIYGGFVAASEAAAVTALYVSVVTLFVRREIPWKELPRVAREAMLLVGAILTILGVALGLTNWLIDQEIPAQLFQAIKTHIDSKIVFLLVLNVFLLAFGMLLEGFPAIVILVPIVLPIATGYGIDPVHLGILFLANLQLGYFTPPLGMKLFIASYRFEKPVLEVMRACWPFFLIQGAAVLLITYWPELSLALVR
jgi:tripartite ATP-independent transporter DctM subunit